ncbi:hypothetical protein [Novipirellula artificiosorum]|uniref:Uncharacterized protein n=1 Tax=Novipirellula artificiosorum TaxID=2528016 RepID=A0A5C6DKM1_9BACT|nr:hypothetical protein [Novipirellula artificiosorum]TWU37410.1 hypothetical protein Poly41_35400 [Novipirellula artificiosorum]
MDRTIPACEFADDRPVNATDRNLTRNLTRSMGDAACFGGMVGCGETYFPAFALAVGLGALTGAGILATLGCESRTYRDLFGILSVRPGAGSVTAPIIASAEE